jgi:hypothetical protein
MLKFVQRAAGSDEPKTALLDADAKSELEFELVPYGVTFIELTVDKGYFDTSALAIHTAGIRRSHIRSVVRQAG